MKFTLRTALTLIAALAALGAFAGQDAGQTRSRGQAAAYPWAFAKGTDTARSTAYDVAEGIAQKAGYASIPQHVAEQAWESLQLPDAKVGKMPSVSSLRKFGKKVHAAVVLYGSASWHTRSIWVGAGPKTISTVTVNVYVYDVKADKVSFSKTKVEGRSDERENGYKVAAAVLISPVVSAVSGGPATPREQRAVQIALARAYYNWAKGKG